MTSHPEIARWVESSIPGGVHWSGTGSDGDIRCPFHDDRNPSCSISAAKEVFLCHACGAKGTLRELADHLGVPYPFSPKTNRGPIEAYHYTDPTGELLFDTVRCDKDGRKSFYQRRPDGNGGYINDLKGVEIVPYRLQDVLDACRKGIPVFVAEGEKDVETLRAWGFRATCNHGGAGKWREAHSKWIPEGSSVYLVGDSDEPGEKHVRQVAGSLVKRKCRAKIIDLGYPIQKDHGKDITDWKLEGHTKDEFRKKMEEAKEWAESTNESRLPNVTTWWDLEKMEFPEPVWLVDPLITEGLTLLVGAPKLGKSWLALNLAIAVAVGGRAVGRLDVHRSDVLYVSLEDSPRRLQNRLKQIGALPDRRLHMTCEWRAGKDAAEDLEYWIDQQRGTKLIIIDPLALVKGRHDPSASLYDIDYATIRPLKELADRHRIALVLVHHTRKQVSEDYLNLVSGTLGLTGAADTIILLKRARGQADAELLVTGRDIEDQEYALRFDRTIGWELVGDAREYRLSAKQKAITDVLGDAGGTMSPKEVAAALGEKEATIRTTMSRMAKDGKLDKLDYGAYSYSAR